MSTKIMYGRLPLFFHVVAVHSSRQYSTIHGVPVKEIQIPVQWGHLSAKLWGSGSQRPVLALHGWQDNAGTWDPLVPLLYNEIHRPVLAIDFPGHGRSSWIPPGMNYYVWDLTRVILLVKEYFKWDRVSLLTHSIGSMAGFRYAAIFPDDVDFYIGVDIIFFDYIDLKLLIDNYPKIFKTNALAQMRLNIDPPSYTREDMIKIWHAGSMKSVAKESVPYLMERGAKPSTQDPKKLYFSRDPRWKYNPFKREEDKLIEAFAMRLKSPTLYIKAMDSPHGNDPFSVSLTDKVSKNNDTFVMQQLPGTHHVHLNNPELVLPVIMKFLRQNNLLEG